MNNIIKIEERPEAVICRLSGEIDIKNVSEIKKAVDRLISFKKPVILINFSRVSYIDSSGLAVMIEARKNIASYGGKLFLCDIPSKIRAVFEITKLEKLFSIFSTESEALSA